MPMPKNSPLPSENLNDSEAWPFDHGIDEIVVRVCSVDNAKDMNPTSYQCLIRHRNRNVSWGVGIRSNPVSAINAAIQDFFAPDKKFSPETAEPSKEPYDPKPKEVHRPQPSTARRRKALEKLKDDTPSVDDLMS